MRYLAYIVWFIVILIGVILTALNSHTVTLDYYFGAVNIYFPLLLVIVLALGALIGVLAMLPKIWRSKNK